MATQIKVASSSIDTVSYDNKTLTITYTTGKVYDYADVPQSVYDDLMKAPSKGKFVNANIKGNYKFAEVAAA